MSLSESEVIEALRDVKDPELERGLVELDLVGAVRTRWAGRVSVTVARAAPSHPQQAELVRRVEEALRRLPGVKEVTVSLADLDEAEAKALAQRLRSRDGGGQGAVPIMRPGSRTRVLGIASGKGGVGKSSVSVNLAIALHRLGRSVAILDSDVYGFSIPRMLGVERPPMVVGDVVVPPLVHGVRCLSTGFFVEDDTPVIWRGPMLHKALEQFLVDAYWGDPDIMVVDMPPGTGDVALSLAQYLPRSEVFVVTTPQAAAQRVAQRSAYMARKLKLPVRGVIENMSWFTGDDGRRYEIFGSGGGQAIADALGVPLVGQVPLVPALRVGGDQGLPVTVSHPAGEAAQAFDALARAIDAMGPARVYRRELTVRS